MTESVPCGQETDFLERRRRRIKRNNDRLKSLGLLESPQAKKKKVEKRKEKVNVPAPSRRKSTRQKSRPLYLAEDHGDTTAVTKDDSSFSVEDTDASSDAETIRSIEATTQSARPRTTANGARNILRSNSNLYASDARVLPAPVGLNLSSSNVVRAPTGVIGILVAPHGSTLTGMITIPAGLEVVGFLTNSAGTSGASNNTTETSETLATAVTSATNVAAMSGDHGAVTAINEMDSTTTTSTNTCAGVSADDEPPLLQATAMDVLCKRGNSSYSHFGNISFRMKCAGECVEYRATLNTSKSAIRKRVAQQVQESGGRFLAPNPRNDQFWTVASPKQIDNKIHFCLRDEFIKLKKGKNK